MRHWYGLASLLRYCGQVPHPGSKTPFAPRFGLNYRITPKTVFRGGYGLFFDPQGNAGTNIRKSLHEYSLEEWHRVMNTNLTSAFLCSRAVHPASGPYAYVRHPIYTGVLLAMLGSALVSGPAWALILIVAASYFVYAALQEEKIMLKEFPDTYPLYRKRTKMLIPFIL